jgi:hypothetical protein
MFAADFKLGNAGSISCPSDQMHQRTRKDSLRASRYEMLDIYLSSFLIDQMSLLDD